MALNPLHLEQVVDSVLKTGGCSCTQSSADHFEGEDVEQDGVQKENVAYLKEEIAKLKTELAEEKRLNKLVTARNTTLEYQAVANGNQPVAPLVQNTITITDAAGAKVFVNGTQLNSEEDKTDDTRQEAATGSRVEETPSGGDQ